MATFSEVCKKLGVVFICEAEHNRAKDWFKRGVESTEKQRPIGSAQTPCSDAEVGGVEIDGIVGRVELLSSELAEITVIVGVNDGEYIKEFDPGNIKIKF